MPSAADLPLAVLLHLQRWPYDADTGQRLTLDAHTLNQQTRLLLAPDPGLDWQQALPELARQQLVEFRDGQLQLSTQGRRRGQTAHRRWMAQGFETLIQRAACPAYEAFCRDAMGTAAGQLSPVDDVQLALLLSCVQGSLPGAADSHKQQHPGRLLDLGCGTGGITAWLAQRIDAIAYGADVAAPSPENAARRYGVGTTKGLQAPSNLQLHRADITALRLPEASFQVLVAIDVVSFLDDPVEVITGWLRLLAPGGRLVILGTEHPDASWEAARRPPNSPAGPGFVAGFSTASVKTCWLDLCAVERRIYRRQQEVLPRLRERFEAEGQVVLYDLLWREAQRYGHWAETRQSRRWLTVLRPV